MIDSEDRYRSTIRVPVPLGKKGNLAILLVLKKGCGKGIGHSSIRTFFTLVLVIFKAGRAKAGEFANAQSGYSERGLIRVPRVCILKRGRFLE